MNSLRQTATLEAHRRARPLVSIIIPSYNHERFLAACLDSIIAQDYTEKEIILIDDGSTDRSPAIAENYARRFPHLIRHERQSNRGVVATCNRGLAMSRGTYLSVIASDDAMCPERLSTLVTLLEQHSEAAFACSDGYYMDERGQTSRRFLEPESRHILQQRSQAIYPYLVENNLILGASVLFRASLAKAVGGYDESIRYVEDWNLWLALAKHHPILFVDRPLILYRVHSGNVSRNATALFEGILQTLIKCYEDRNAPLDTRTRIRAFQNAIRNVGIHLLRMELGSIEENLQRSCHDGTYLTALRPFIPGFRLRIRQEVGALYYQAANEKMILGRSARARQYLLQSMLTAPWNPRAYLKLPSFFFPRRKVAGNTSVRTNQPED